MSFLSFVGDTIKSAAFAVTKTVGRAFQKMADVGEKIISKVKETWPKVRTVLKNVHGKGIPPVKDALNWLIAVAPPQIGPVPVRAILLGVRNGVEIVDKGLCALFKLENSPILKKIDEYASKIFPLMRKVGREVENWSDMMKEVHQSNIIQRELTLLTKNVSNEKETLVVKMLSVLNRLSKLKIMAEYKLKDFAGSMQEYMQIAFCGKICGKFIAKINEGATFDDLNKEDLFFFDAAEIILGDKPVLEDEQKAQFVKLVEKAFGKSFMAAVYEEMVLFWSADIKNKLIEFEAKRREIIEQERKGTVNASKKEEYEKLNEFIEGRKYYVYAAEALLLAEERKLRDVVSDELAEDIEEQLEDLVDAVVKAFDKNIPFANLDQEDKMLIRNLAIKFQKASEARVDNNEKALPNMERLGEVEVVVTV